MFPQRLTLKLGKTIKSVVLLACTFTKPDLVYLKRCVHRNGAEAESVDVFLYKSLLVIATYAPFVCESSIKLPPLW